MKGGFAHRFVPVCRVDQLQIVAVKPLAELLLGITQQLPQIPAHLHQGELPVVAALLHPAQQTRQGPLLPLLQIRLGRAPVRKAGHILPDQKQVLAARVARVHPQQGEPPAHPAASGAVEHSVGAGDARNALINNALHLPAHKLQGGVAVVRVDRRLRKGAQRFLKIAAAFQRFKVVAGQIHHMIRPCGEIGLHHRGSQIAKKRKIFELPHARGILWRQRGRCARFALLRRRLSRLSVVRIAAGQGGELAPHLFEALQQPGRKLPALAVQDHLKRLAGRDGLLVNPVGGKGVVAVRHTHGLRFQGDGVPPQSIRVSCAVPALVMRAADVVSAVQIIPVSGLFQRRQHFAALYGVILHPLVFCRGQGPGLIQNGVRNGYLSDVVHCRRAADHLDARLV